MATSIVESLQAAEVTSLKEAFPGRCRIIKDVGMFSHVVTLQPKDMDVTLKFQLTGSYPSSAPQVSVRSESLTKEDNEELTQTLLCLAKNLLGQEMLKSLVTEAEMWLKQHGVKPGKAVVPSTESCLTEDNKRKKKKPKNRKKNKDEEDEDKKKPSMKTADDVVKRILWDEKLDKDDFLVGYLDRFKGIVEKYFSAFSWEDLASVDYDVLAVPKHRIQYFKYRSQTIWEKATRTDNVFGSTGSGITIYEVINNYKEPEKAGNQRHSDKSDSDYEASSDDDDEDGITVTIGSSVNTAALETKMKQHGGDNVAKGEGEDRLSYDPFWQDKLRPNYFLAIRVTDPEIREGVEQVQDYLLDNEPLYGPCCIQPSALHITLCTLGLDTPEALAHAREALQRIQPDVASALPKRPIRFAGVANFFNRVVYAKVEPDPELLDFVGHVTLLVREAGLEVRDQHEFVPHMTIMKVTRPVARQKGTKNVDPWLYSSFEDMAFGLQRVDALYLCSMGDERRADGFYLCPAEIHFPTDEKKD